MINSREIIDLDSDKLIMGPVFTRSEVRYKPPTNHDQDTKNNLWLLGIVKAREDNNRFTNLELPYCPVMVEKFINSGLVKIANTRDSSVITYKITDKDLLQVTAKGLRFLERG